ncbi:hypothetical protein MAR_013373 [Mya arenaria]|uniref:Uncharacterized protein n=1 Tax=Mya arenaria TaxID=6604 RepID=A0ABY7G2P2_MYAAR|nr:hypothetical protein MAR_013373 [Mya arenaria]
MVRGNVSEFHWDSCFDTCIDTYVDNFTTSLLELCNVIIPNKIITVRKSDPEWMNNSIRLNILKRKRAFDKANGIIYIKTGLATIEYSQTILDDSNKVLPEYRPLKVVELIDSILKFLVIEITRALCCARIDDASNTEYQERRGICKDKFRPVVEKKSISYSVKNNIFSEVFIIILVCKNIYSNCVQCGQDHQSDEF